MKKVIILIILIMGCSSYKNDFVEKIFGLEVQNTELVNFNSIKTVGDLNDFFCQIAKKDKSKKLMLPFDFYAEKFNQRANLGIKVIGNPMKCSPILCYRSTMKFELKEKEWKAYFQPALENIDSLFNSNMMNYGYNPSLSEQPKSAIFELSSYSETDLKSLNKIIGSLAKAYLNFLQHRASDTNSIDSLKKEFPLNIMISELYDLPPVPVDSTLIKEIEGDLEIDLK